MWLAVELKQVLVVLAGILIVSLVLTSIWWAAMQARKRREALAALADALRFSFDPDMNASFDERFQQFGLFQQGHTRRAYNTMRGTAVVGGADHNVIMGDYKYTITSHNGKSTTNTTYHLSYVLVDIDLQTPELVIRKEHFFDKVGAALGFDDIDFESAEFSRKYAVKSTNKRFAWDLIDPLMIEWFLDLDKPPLFELDGGWLLVARKRAWPVEAFQTHLDLADAFVSRWPAHCVHTLQETGYPKE